MSNTKKVGVITIDADGPGRDLTPMQQAFVVAFTSGQDCAGNARLSAIAAGYSEKTAYAIGSSLVRHAGISAAIDAALRDEIGTTLTVQAVRVVRQIIQDENAPLKLRGDMAAKVLEFSGIVERTKAQKAKDTGIGGTKTLAEMSRAELEAVIAQGAAVLKAAAGTAGDDAQVIEGRVSAADSAAPLVSAGE